MYPGTKIKAEISVDKSVEILNHTLTFNKGDVVEGRQHEGKLYVLRGDQHIKFEDYQYEEVINYA